MADERRDCIDEILAGIQDRRDRKFVRDRLEDLDDRASNDSSSASYREALGKAATEMLIEEGAKSAIRRRNLRMDAVKHRDLRTFTDAAVARDPVNGWRLGIEAQLVGVNTPLFDPKSRRGGQQSAAALGLGAQKAWIGGAVTDMERLAATNPAMAGLDNIFYSRKFETEIFIERYELTMGDRGKPGRTKNGQALEIAKILEKWDKTRVDALNSEGAWISNYSGYVNKTFHDPDRMRVAGRPAGMRALPYKGMTEADRMAWVGKTLPLLDAKRTFGTDVDADKKLAEMYGGLIDGSHMEMQVYSADPVTPNLAAQESARRELHFKSAEAWLEYNKLFGRFSPTDGWVQNMRSSANHYGLMKLFGSKPKEGYNDLITYAKNKTMGTAAYSDLTSWRGERALNNRYAVVSGEVDRPIGNSWSGIVNGVLAVQRMSKLGLTPFAMLADNATLSRELGRQGIDFVTRNQTLFSGYFRGAEGSEKAEVADLLHTGILGRLRGVAARYDVSDARSGIMASLENTFFKITGITGMTENKRADSERIMAYWMGKQRGKDFAALGDGERNILEQFGISDKEWALLHKAEWNEIAGKTYLTPDVAQKISDADMKAYLNQRGLSADGGYNVTPEKAAANELARIERARTDLAMKLWSYYSERGNFAVLEVGAREKAMLYQGTESGSPLNTALRMLLQFKQFPTAMITKVWGAEVYGGQSTMGKVSGIAELIVTTTLFGMVANALNDTVKGIDPTSRYREKPFASILAGFVRGGAGTIYGDFLLGEWSRHGQSLSQSILGPSLGQVDAAAEMWADITRARGTDKFGNHALRFARNNLPYGNMIYTKSAIDYLVYYRLMETINPGYLERLESTMKSKNGQEFWLRPTQVSR